MKARWHHADDCVNATADRDLLPEHSIVAAEALLPKLVTEDRNEIRAWPVLIVREPAADQGLDAERREKAGGNDLRLHLDRIAGAGEIQARFARTSSFSCSTPPISIIAARRASSSFIPCFIFFSVNSST